MSVALFLEIKNEYTEHLVDTLTPYLYEGLTCIYKDAVKMANETNSNEKTLMIFQKLLQSINNWNQQRITEETDRIKKMSNTADYLDDLVKSVIKSNIILLTYSNTISNVIGQSFYNGLTTPTFVHRCYTECGKDANNNPYLFFHDIDAMDYKRNQIIINQHIQAGITRAIRKILPLSMILKEYLVNSANIIQEPPRVELLGLPKPAENASIFPPNLAQPTAVDNVHLNGGNQASLTKMDPNLEKEVMKIIKSESVKTEKQKIRDIMNIDKILTSMEPKVAEFDGRGGVSSARRELFSAGPDLQGAGQNLRVTGRKRSDFIVAPHLLEGEEEDNDIINHHLGKSDKKILNINFDEEPTVDNAGPKKSVSATSLSSRGMPGNRSGPRMNPETSERIDPTKVNLIEDYGTQMGGSKRYNKR